LIGLGLMGMPIARRLLAAGYLLAAHNRSRDKVEGIAAEGAVACSSPAEVVARSDVVLTALPTVETVREVYLGPEGLVSAAPAGLLLIDLSTVGPSLSREIAAAADARGVAFLDAPVSGGPEGAEQGTLTVMCGGDGAAFVRAEPVFRAFGRTIRHVGPSGSGSAIKLVNQLLVATHTLAAVEAAKLATAAGLDLELVLELIAPSYGASRMVERNLPRIIAARYEPGGPVDIVRKDVQVIADFAAELGVSLPLQGAVRAVYDQAHAAGFGNRDMAALFLLDGRR
jgi:3-hydroxyisobutyrate dehydrogenase-like beta-hydroxyacid dehydrogenase